MRSLVAALLLCAFASSSVNATQVMTGIASVDFGHATRFDGASYRGLVATGERFRANILAVAHRSLPLKSCVAVFYQGRLAVAVVNDRGPCLSAYCQSHAPARVRARVLDMTPLLAARLNFSGLGRVTFWPTQCP